MSETGQDDDTTAAIMEATYRALCDHGYPDTSISTITDEFDKSRSLLYYHYENKDELLADFLRYLLDQLEADLQTIEADDPYEEVLAIVERLLPPDIESERFRFYRALFGMRSQAPYVDAYREQFARSDTLILAELTDAVERGIDAGTFQLVDADEVAQFVYATVSGALQRSVTLDDPEMIEHHLTLIESYLQSQVVDREDEPS